mgnify:CR=1 FL=1
MDTRVALIGIIVENMDSTPELNKLLHEYGSYIIGRMGLPYRERNVHIISVAIDAPQDVINALSGKIGRLDGITAKTVYSNVGISWRGYELKIYTLGKIKRNICRMPNLTSRKTIMIGQG